MTHLCRTGPGKRCWADGDGRLLVAVVQLAAAQLDLPNGLEGVLEGGFSRPLQGTQVLRRWLQVPHHRLQANDPCLRAVTNCKHDENWPDPLKHSPVNDYNI